MTYTIKNLIIMLSTAPDSQIDKTVCQRLLKLADNPNAAEMKVILEDCAYWSLANGFAMVAMDVVYRQLLSEETK